MAKDPTAVASKWATNLGNSTQSITDGINAVTVAPGQAAARQKQVWQQNTSAAADKWATNTAKVTLQEWQQAALQKGVGRIAAGATAAQNKQVAFYTKLLPFIDSAKASLPPRGNLDQNIARANAMMRKMATFSNS